MFKKFLLLALFYIVNFSNLSSSDYKYIVEEYFADRKLDSIEGHKKGIEIAKIIVPTDKLIKLCLTQKPYFQSSSGFCQHLFLC